MRLRCRLQIAVCITMAMLLSRVIARPSDDRSPSSSKSQQFTGLTAQEYQDVFDRYVSKGYRPVAIRGYAKNGQATYDVTLEQRSGHIPRTVQTCVFGSTRHEDVRKTADLGCVKYDWVARHGLSESAFQAESRRQEAEGYKLAIHSRFFVNKTAIHAAVWERMPIRFHESDRIPESGRTSPKWTPFDDLMRSFVRRYDIPGAALAVAQGDRIVYARGFGYADLEQRQVVRPDSLFRIASLSKPITATAIFQLVEQNKLKLTDRVLEVLNEPPSDSSVNGRDPRWSRITILQLLHHTGGWDRDVSFDPMFRSIEIAERFGTVPPATPDQIVRYMLERPLDFAPGTRYAYSNFGYCLLGRVIERITGRTYEGYVQRNILRPLGITRMRIGKSVLEGRVEGEVRYYTRHGAVTKSVVGGKSGRRVPVQYGGWCLESMDAHGGWIASAIDLVRFAVCLDTSATKKVLSSSSLKTMYTPPAAPVWRDPDRNLKSAYYACGWMVRPVGDSSQANTWHSGALDGTSTLLVRRHDGLTWAVLFNTGRTPTGDRPSGLIDGKLHQAANAVHW